ncbi:MAG: RNase H family protein [Pyrinomonadaceae bacterium]
MRAYESLPTDNSSTSADTYAPIISIYADGSCLRNGMPDSASGTGAVVIDHNRRELRLQAIYLGPGTNQQAEIAACTNALRLLQRPCRIEIFSDSRYVIDTMAGRNRIKSNRSLWDGLIRACYRHHVTWRWLRGHSGVVFQEIADRLSRAAADLRSGLSEDELEIVSRLVKVDSDETAIGAVEQELRRLAAGYQSPRFVNWVDDINVNSHRQEFAFTPPSAF